MKTSKTVYSIVGSMSTAEKEAMIEVDLESRNLRSSEGTFSNQKNEYRGTKSINVTEVGKLTEKAELTTVYAIGKRKASIAKVWMTPGNGEILINGKTLDKWLGGQETLKMKVRLPLQITKQLDLMNIKATTLGGGYASQSDALKHGIMKALVEFEPTFRETFAAEGLFTHNTRIKNYKRPGKKKVKYSIQSSKR